MSFRNIRDEGIQKVASAGERLLLLPPDGTVVLQLDNHTLYVYDQITNTWNAVGAGTSGFAFGVIQTDTGTAPTADTLSDSLTLTTAETSAYSFGGNALTDTVTLTINTANTTQKGLLSSADWNTFNNKVDYITSIVNALIFG
jgi:hypothetical protein